MRHQRLGHRLAPRCVAGAIAIGLCVLAGAATAQTVPREIRVGPFLQQATPTSIWVVWETTSGDESRVDYGGSPALGLVANGLSQVSVDPNRIHQAQLTGLAPDTTYYYRVATGDAVGEVEHFRTPPRREDERPFRFVAYSDNQRDDGNPTKHGEVVRDGIIGYVNQRFGADVSDELSFVLNAGDLVNDGWVYDDWKRDYFDEAKPLISRIPSYPVLGNHEGLFSPFYFLYFRLPENGTPGFLEHWWYHDHGNVRLIGLDSNDFFRMLPGQETWLQQTLDAACVDPYIDFVFAQLHHPFKSELWLPGEVDFTGRVIERLERFSTECKKPSIHFFGHTHAYSRGQSRDHTHLWVNVASAEGNIDYWGEEPQADYPEFQKSLPEWGFALVEVEAGNDPRFTLSRVSRGNEIEPRDNEVRDRITIQLHDRAPATPVPLAPVGPDEIAPEHVRLEASAFGDPDDQSLLESHFQVSAVPGNWSTPVAERWLRVENWYAPPGASGPANGYYSVNTVTDPDVTHTAIVSLPPEKDLYWRVRYRDDGLTWSEWSEPAAFRTGSSSLGPNRLANPGAEEGTSGWLAVLPPIESVAPAECGPAFVPLEGERFFAVGGVCAGEQLVGKATQFVDVFDQAGMIDSGAASVSFGGWVRDLAGDDDKPDIWITFRPFLGKELGRTAKYWARAADWAYRGDVVPVPPGTRTIEMALWGTRLEGVDNDSYFDGLHLSVGPTSALP